MTESCTSDTTGPRDLSHAELQLVAHEMRGALTVIAGYAALLRHPLNEAESQAALDGIERAIARVDVLCSNALNGQAPLPASAQIRENVRLLVLSEEVAADQRSATGRTISVSGDDSAEAIGDPQALARVLTNVVGNAAKYSPEDSAIEIRVGVEQQPLLGKVAIVEVADRGPGVPAEMREHVFEPFARLERDETAPGTGLGLAIVRNVVEAHGGAVGIADREGGGTVVRIELPARL